MFVDLIMYTVVLATVGHIIIHVMWFFRDLITFRNFEHEINERMNREIAVRVEALDYLHERISNLEKDK